MKKRSIINTVGIYILVSVCALSVAYGTSVATTTVANMIPMEREHTVIIDAGHGGVDGGATSCTGVQESEINLQICLKLEDLFHLLGFRTVMIRRTDISVYTSGETVAAKKVSDLRQRVKAVNEAENPVLVSIHQNTFSDEQYAGAQVFYGPEGEGEQLAEAMQKKFLQTLNLGSNRAAKKAEGIYLMQHINYTGVLIECGFLSNPAEEAKLRSEDYQKKLSCVIGAVTAEFLT